MVIFDANLRFAVLATLQSAILAKFQLPTYWSLNSKGLILNFEDFFNIFCLFWLVKLPFSKFWLISFFFILFESNKTDEAKDELFQEDISTYINSQVTAQVLRRTSLKRKELCISPKRGINPNSSQINRQNRRSEPILEISKSTAPLRDTDDMIAQLNRYCLFNSRAGGQISDFPLFKNVLLVSNWSSLQRNRLRDRLKM